MQALKYDTVEDKWHTVNQKVLAGYGNPGTYATQSPFSLRAQTRLTNLIFQGRIITPSEFLKAS